MGDAGARVAEPAWVNGAREITDTLDAPVGIGLAARHEALATSVPLLGRSTLG